MSLFCPDGKLADLPPPGPPPPKPERGAPWKPPENVLCARCSRASWQHTSHPPALADDMDRAIYAAAFVSGMRTMFARTENGARAAVAEATELVELHRRARSGA